MARTPAIGTAAALVLAAACATACGPPSETDAERIAEIDGSPVKLAEFEAYLAVNLPADPSADPDEESHDQVMSRLLDNFVLERILLRHALAAGFEVSDREVMRYLSMGSGERPEPPALDPSRFEAVRQVLTVQKFREAWLRKTVTIEPGMLDAYVAQQRDRLVPQESVVLRSLLMASPEQAEQVYGEIRRRRMTFDEAVVAYSSMPGQDTPVEMARQGLPPVLDEAVAKLRPGRVTRPVELHGGTYLFQLVSRRTGSTVSEEELRARAEEELLERLRNEELWRLEAELLQESSVTRHPANLPFRYRPEGGK